MDFFITENPEIVKWFIGLLGMAVTALVIALYRLAHVTLCDLKEAIEKINKTMRDVFQKYDNLNGRLSRLEGEHDAQHGSGNWGRRSGDLMACKEGCD